MATRILMNVSDGDECRIAIVRDGVLEEYFVDRPSQLKHVGDVYRGVVSNTEPAIQAVFVDIGYKKNAFLHVSDVVPAYNPRSHLTDLYGAKPVEITAVEDIDFSVVSEIDEEDEEGARAAAPAHADQADGGGREGGKSAAYQQSRQEAAMQETVAVEREMIASSDASQSQAAEPSAVRGEQDGEAADVSAKTTRRRPSTRRRTGKATGKAADAGERKPASSDQTNADVVPPEQGDAAPAGKTTRRRGGARTTAKRAPGDAPRTRRRSTKTSVNEEKSGADGGSGNSGDIPADGGSTPSASAMPQQPGRLLDGRQSESKDDDGGFGVAGMVNGAPVRFRREPMPRVQNVLHRGQEVLVQVIKAAQGGKGPGVTTYISLPGRYMVLMPNTTKCGVSRKITDWKLRDELRHSLKRLRIPKGMGVIIRTAAAGRPIEELQRDLNYLLRRWNDILEDVNSGTRGPSCPYRDSDPAMRTVRDSFTADVAELVIDRKEVYERVLAFVDDLMPDYRNRVRLYDGDLPLFVAEGIEPQVEHIFDKKITLPSGGYLYIEQTEALVAIDVNSGRFTSERDAEETAYKTNLEAVPEIARQLRLRDLGGIIVNDFIDMLEARHRRDVEERLKTELRRDRARVKVASTSPFGLIEMTRQRVRPSIRSYVYDACGACKGSGYVRNPQTQALFILRMMRMLLSNEAASGVVVQASAAALSYISSTMRGTVTDIELRYRKTIVFEWEPSFAPEDVKFWYVNYRGDRTSYDHTGEMTRIASVHQPRPLLRMASDAGGDRGGGRRGRRGGRGRRPDRGAAPPVRHDGGPPQIHGEPVHAHEHSQEGEHSHGDGHEHDSSQRHDPEGMSAPQATHRENAQGARSEAPMPKPAAAAPSGNRREPGAVGEVQQGGERDGHRRRRGRRGGRGRNRGRDREPGVPREASGGSVQPESLGKVHPPGGGLPARGDREFPQHAPVRQSQNAPDNRREQREVPREVKVPERREPASPPASGQTAAAGAQSPAPKRHVSARKKVSRNKVRSRARSAGL